MRMRALYASNYFTAGPPARRFDNPYFIPSTQVLLQQLVNKGKAVTPPAVATPPPTPAAPDAATAGATGAERAPPVNPPESNKAAAIQKAFNKSVADQKARNKAKKDAKELADKDAFGKKQGEKTKLKDAKATKIQNDFNKAVRDSV